MKQAPEPKLITLPIDSHLPEIAWLVSAHQWTLIKASPGAGKTTRVPAYLKKQVKGKVLVLEPRRLAAKMQAMRIAEELGVELGEEVGFIFKGEKAVSLKTEILFVTEGTFLRLYENDPLLSEFDLIILDEFHERHLETDAAFYCLNKTSKERPDLKLIIMSATLDMDLLKSKLPQLAEFVVHLAPFERQTHHLPNTPSVLNRDLALKIKDVITEQCLQFRTEEIMGVLVFLPGKKEIDECLLTLNDDPTLQRYFDIAILHGELSKAEQLYALSPSEKPKKKIVLATNIAESSITIPFINVVIDSGLERILMANPVTGFGELVTKKIDRASAEQRAGRSNRVMKGYVFRLYSQLDFDSRPAHKIAEIFRSPLEELFLSILQTQNKIEREYFLDAPKDFQEKTTFKKLLTLGLINQDLFLTDLGKKTTGIFPLRINLILNSLTSVNEHDLKLVQQILQNHLPMLYRRDFQLALNRKFLENAKSINIDQTLLTGYIDLVGFHKNQRITLHNGETFQVHSDIKANLQHLSSDQPLIVLDISPQNFVTTFYAIDKNELHNFPHLLTSEKTEEIISNKKKLKTLLKYGLISIHEKIEYVEINTNDKEIVTRKMLDEEIDKFKHSPTYQRLKFFNHFFAKNHHLEDFEWSTFLEIFVLEFMELPIMEQSHKDYFFDELTKEILNFLSPDDGVFFTQYFPDFLSFSDRRKTPVHYEIHGDQYIVYVESYIQDFYGIKETPSIAKGKLELSFKLLGPHKRALQVTKDLKSFWRSAYREMYKELNREYPRHHWPLEPENALPVLLKRQLPITS